MAASLTSVKAIVMYRGDVPEGIDAGFPVHTWDQFMEVQSIKPFGGGMLFSGVKRREGDFFFFFVKF